MLSAVRRRDPRGTACGQKRGFSHETFIVFPDQALHEDDLLVGLDRTDWLYSTLQRWHFSSYSSA
jgi:hypothetical protein